MAFSDFVSRILFKMKFLLLLVISQFTFYCDGIILKPTLEAVIGSSESTFKNESLLSATSRHIPADNNLKIYEAQYFPQKVDNFHAKDKRTWNQRYWIISAIDYLKGGPVFVFISGQESGNPYFLQNSDWGRLIVKYKALAYVVEHRYYGHSQPLGENPSVDEMKYLTTNQALVDLKKFITKMKSSDSDLKDSNSKWIVFGSDYAGSLAILLKKKYPEMITAAYASSSPIKSQYEFPEFFEVVRGVLKKHYNACLDKIQKATKKLKELMKSEAGKSNIKNFFKLCKTPVDSKDIELFYHLVTEALGTAVQYNDNNGRSSLVAQVCKRMAVKVNDEQGLVANLGDAIMSIFRNFGIKPCYNISYTEAIKNLRDLSNARALTYQHCTEYGYHPTTEKIGDVFPPINLKFLNDICTDLFEPRFTAKLNQKSIAQVNKLYENVELTPNILVVHGSYDPWHKLGIVPNNKNFVLLDGASHSTDTSRSGIPYREELMKAKEFINKTLDSWINN